MNLIIINKKTIRISGGRQAKTKSTSKYTKNKDLIIHVQNGCTNLK